MIAPERLIRIPVSVRAKRRLMGQMQCNFPKGRTTRHEGYVRVTPNSIKHRKPIDLRRDNDPPDGCEIRFPAP